MREPESITVTLRCFPWHSRLWLRLRLAYFVFTIGASDRITFTEPPAVTFTERKQSERPSA